MVEYEGRRKGTLHPKRTKVRSTNLASLFTEQDLPDRATLLFEHERHPDLYQGLQRKLIDYQNEIGTLRNLIEELEEEKSKYRDLFDHAPIGYLIVDRNGVILDANLAATDLLGVTKDKMRSMPVSAFILKEYIPAFLTCFNRSRYLVTPSPCEVVLRRMNAAPFCAQLHIVEAKDDRNLPCFRVAVSDITESTLLEKLMRKESQPSKQKSHSRPVPRKKGRN